MAQAILVGVGVGLVGVGCFVVLLMSANKVGDVPAPSEEAVEVSAEVQQTATFYAVQHGAFTSEESAKAFMTTYPTLNKALVIQVEQNFYVWSALAMAKKELAIEPQAFMKKFTFVSAGCDRAQISTIPNLLQDEKALKLNFDESEKDKVSEEWVSFMTGLTTLSDDVDVLRLHSLAHFYEKESCLNVQFDL